MGGYVKYQKNYSDRGAGKRAWAPEYKKFRVKSPIRTFRDLEVYKQTTQLSARIFRFELPETVKMRKKLAEETRILYELSKDVPRLIAECYGDKFSNFNLAMEKLEKTMQIISDIIAKIDFLIAALGAGKGSSEEIRELTDILKKYQGQRAKILNLKNAWDRVLGK